MSMAHLPHEILSSVCAVAYEASLSNDISLDPSFTPLTETTPTALPSSYPPSSWSELTTRRTLASLCLVNRAWFNAAKPYLWRHIEIRQPRSWLAFVEQVAGPDPAEFELMEATAERLVISRAASLASRAAVAGGSSEGSAELLERSIQQQLLCHKGALIPHDSVPAELLTPPASREPSPARLRAKSPVRWRFLRAVSDAVQSLEPDVYVPTPDDPQPGRHVHHLDFNHFRTIGMRRSGEEAARSRFVTAERLERVLKEMPHLGSFGATEYMDGALNTSVLRELLLRGKALAFRGQASVRGRQQQDVTMQTDEEMDEDMERLKDCKGLQALDLCGCVSSVFVQGLDEIVREYFADEVAEDGTITPSEVTIPSIKRLGMRGVTSVPANILTPFVLAFTSLTHLDLSGTRCNPDLLAALADSASVQLKSFAIARCSRLTSESIADFLIDGLPARTITQLSLYGDGTFITPLTEMDLVRIVKQAPCFQSGEMEYLDLSSCPVTSAVLDAFVPHPVLRSLGLSHIGSLPLGEVAKFILTSAPNVEVLTLVNTSPELAIHISPRQVPLSLHTLLIRPLATAPFHFSLTGSSAPKPPPTRLRVVELTVGVLNALGAGGEAWKIVRSKGGRGWYVDAASGWENGNLRRDLPPNHPMRVELERLAASNGNVSGGVGWHARKMEVLSGQGLMGREDGLYGAVSFAYQG
ncbi:hypothetical protein M407DRAFT_3387 [Tulasnella calospora MUT 4182]|uniref:Uncharacterized protein n=1 Tax=Tulasnella calospora MUT 4182 TaxID=1051891 RepID=A0A0C3QXH0_9AGAM|nr:hypothetical protein M407DRAFT_3387 [Tulasnella calospora MUT 4182]